MEAKELLNQINNARQMLQTAADECSAKTPDLRIILENVSRAQELCLDADFACGDEMQKRHDDAVNANLNAKIEEIATMITGVSDVEA